MPTTFNMFNQEKGPAPHDEKIWKDVKFKSLSMTRRQEDLQEPWLVLRKFVSEASWNLWNGWAISRNTHKKNEQTNKQTNQTNRQTNKQTNKQTSKAMKQRMIFIPILNPFTKRTSKECSLLLFWGGEIASFRVCSDADGVWASVKSVLPPKTAAACSACCSNPRKGKLLPNPAGPRRFFRRLDTTGGVDSLIEARHAEFLFVAC